MRSAIPETVKLGIPKGDRALAHLLDVDSDLERSLFLISPCVKLFFLNLQGCKAVATSAITLMETGSQRLRKTTRTG
jgi:hypothetical protein